jgi:hypothetical protein
MLKAKGRKMAQAKKGSSSQQIVCPRCGAKISQRLVKTYFARATGLVSRGLPGEVETECCQRVLTFDEVKKLRWGSEAAATRWGRKLSAARKTFGAGTGRPKVTHKCPFCGLPFGGRELREHKPRCPEKPRANSA